MKKISIAIDGPAGAGKSTIAKAVAKKLGCTYIDTGAMYRAVGLYCIQNDINYHNEGEVSAVLTSLKIDFHPIDGQQHIYLNDVDVSTAIRTDEVAAVASKVATYKEVREALVSQQRLMQREKSVVMDGRDIGTVVMPDASLKIFLTASASERAQRRFDEYQSKGIPVTLEELTQEIIDRDYQDSNREISPLRKADNAIEIDTTLLTIEEIVNRVMDLIRNNK